MKKSMFICILFSLFFLLSSCDTLVIQDMGTFFALDTTISVTFYNEDDTLKHYRNIKDIYYNVDKLASDFTDNKTNIYALNKSREIEYNEELYSLIRVGIEAMELTNGYFNPFIGKISHLWKDALEKGTLPDNKLINAYLLEMNETSVIVDNNKIKLIGNGNLDLGGIAKGYATEEVRRYLDTNGLKYYYINAGRSNVLLGSKKEALFRITFEKPFGDGYYFTYSGKNIAIATSSPKYQHVYIDDILYHHIISPFTGYPLNIYESVNVFTDNSYLADVYSTALYLMEYDDALKFIKEKKIKAILYNQKIVYKSEDLV